MMLQGVVWRGRTEVSSFVLESYLAHRGVTRLLPVWCQEMLCYIYNASNIMLSK